MEPPSAELSRQLAELRLCTPRELQRAARRVRRLAGGLPIFDSIWLDALVGLRALTPYQARQLEAATAGRLRLGQALVLDELQTGPDTQTFLARLDQASGLYAAKLCRLPAEQIGPAIERLQRVLQALRGVRDPHLSVLERVDQVGPGLLVISRLAPGMTLEQLLVRRGRLPSSIVGELAQQLLNGLETLHRRGVVHGELRAANVRISPNGTAVLVDAGVARCLRPAVLLHQLQSPDHYDCLAPELIGVTAASSAASDLYSLGCLLWQLLAGRPPFPQADPRQKLAAHQTQRVVDIRELAPETAPELADLIIHLTAPQPIDRPKSAADARQRWSRLPSSGRAAVAAVTRSPETLLPHFRGDERRTVPRWPIAAAALAGALMLTTAWLEQRHPGQILAIWQQLPAALSWNLPSNPVSSGRAGSVASRDAESVGSTTTHSATRTASLGGPGERGTPAATTSSATWLTIPPASPDGVIELASGDYAAAEITHVGPLTLRAAPGACVTVRIDRSPLRIAAQQLIVDGLQFRSGNRTADDVPVGLLWIRAQNVLLNRCRFESRFSDSAAFSSDDSGDLLSGVDQSTGLGPTSRAGSTGVETAVAWRVLNRQHPTGQRLIVRDTQFDSSGSAIFCADGARQLVFERCLKLGAGPLITWGRGATQASPQLRLEHCTLRQSGPLLRWFTGDATETLPRFDVTLRHSVVDAIPGLIEAISAGSRPVAWDRTVMLRGDNSVISPLTDLMGRRPSLQSPWQPIDTSELQVDDLAQGELQFRGDVQGGGHDHELLRFAGPRHDGPLPGYSHVISFACDPAAAPESADRSSSLQDGAPRGPTARDPESPRAATWLNDSTEPTPEATAEPSTDGTERDTAGNDVEWSTDSALPVLPRLPSPAD